jgi:hypothetical protein
MWGSVGLVHPTLRRQASRRWGGVPLPLPRNSLPWDGFWLAGRITQLAVAVSEFGGFHLVCRCMKCTQLHVVSKARPYLANGLSDLICKSVVSGLEGPTQEPRQMTDKLKSRANWAVVGYCRVKCNFSHIVSRYIVVRCSPTVARCMGALLAPPSCYGLSFQ